MTGLNLTDMEVFTRFQEGSPARHRHPGESLRIRGEITAKCARPRGGVRSAGVYYGRSYTEGKKITWRDGFWAIWCILKYSWSE